VNAETKDQSMQWMHTFTKQKKKKQTPWPLVRERTIPTERPPLVDEILVPTFVDKPKNNNEECLLGYYTMWL
jgi:hypothetical protein